jgi:hypothetical protein
MILGGCITNTLVNLCDCEYNCSQSSSTADDLMTCNAGCATTRAATTGACMDTYDDALIALSATAGTCESSCLDASAACEEGCDGGDPDCIPGCISTYCNCENACTLDLYEALSDPQNDQASCISQACTLAGGPSPTLAENLTYATCVLTAAQAFNTALNAAYIAYLTVAGPLECSGDPTTDAGGAYGAAILAAGYAQTEALCTCAAKNAQAQKVCGGLTLSPCYCTAQKAWDAGDVDCLNTFQSGGSTDTAGYLACQNANKVVLWGALLTCCWALFGPDAVSKCVQTCAETQLDCGDGDDCGTDYTTCKAACYAAPIVAPCSGCDLLFV